MNTVHLHGRLREEFGGPFDLDIETPAEAIRALSQLPGFPEAISKGSWRVVRGKENGGHALDKEALDLKLGSQPLHVIPAAEGAGDGAGKVIVGAVMIAAAFYTGGASIAAWSSAQMMAGATGAGMLVAGAASMMAPTPQTGSYEEKEQNKQSYLFNGPVNVSKQGVAVPLIYGEVITGSVVVSAGIRANDIPIDSSGNEQDAEYLEGK